jgi:hypothetical protein
MLKLAYAAKRVCCTAILAQAGTRAVVIAVRRGAVVRHEVIEPVASGL